MFKIAGVVDWIPGAILVGELARFMLLRCDAKFVLGSLKFVDEMLFGIELLSLMASWLVVEACCVAFLGV